MAAFTPHPALFPALGGQVVVLSGGANGIGAGIVALFSAHGAKVVFGDIDEAGGATLVASFPESVHFVRTDVTSYASVLALFQEAFELYGRVDIAISNAGLVERPGWFDPSLNLQTIQTCPTTAVLDVNLVGSLYFANIAMVYLRQHASPAQHKSLILVSSLAGFEESPGLFVYQAAKHGIIGLLRSLRKYVPTAYGQNVSIKVNCVSPWATKTAMTTSFSSAWEQEGLPMNSSAQVAEIVAAIAVDKELNGEKIYVEGGRGWAVEEKIESLESLWLGEAVASELSRGQIFLGDGSKWSG